MKKGMPLVAAYPFPLSFSRSFSLQLLQQLDQGFGLIIRLAFRRAGAVNQSRRNAQGLRAPNIRLGVIPRHQAAGAGAGQPLCVLKNLGARLIPPQQTGNRHAVQIRAQPQFLHNRWKLWIVVGHQDIPNSLAFAPSQRPDGILKQAIFLRLENPLSDALGGPALPRRLVDKPPQAAAP